jgi:hypothetical protein
MGELKLSPEARRRFWQCISLFLTLADEAEKNIAADTESDETSELATKAEQNKLTRTDRMFQESKQTQRNI